MRLFLILFMASPAFASPWLDGPKVTASKPDSCSCGKECLCKDGRIDPRCVCENCRCADVKVGRNEQATRPRQTNQTPTFPTTQTRSQTVKVEYGPAGGVRSKTLADGTRIEYGPLGREISRTKSAVVVPQVPFPSGRDTTRTTSATVVVDRNSVSRNLMPMDRTRIVVPAGILGGTNGCSAGG